MPTAAKKKLSASEAFDRSLAQQIAKGTKPAEIITTATMTVFESVVKDFNMPRSGIAIARISDDINANIALFATEAAREAARKSGIDMPDGTQIVVSPEMQATFLQAAVSKTYADIGSYIKARGTKSNENKGITA